MIDGLEKDSSFQGQLSLPLQTTVSTDHAVGLQQTSRICHVPLFSSHKVLQILEAARGKIHYALNAI